MSKEKVTTEGEVVLCLNIFERINEVRKEVKYVQKDLQVLDYRAVSHDAVTSAVRNACIKHGIIIWPHVDSSKMREVKGAVTTRGVQQYRYECVVHVGFVNMEAPDDRIIMRVDAHGIDSQDKAPGKALSMATKYAMLKMFMLETGENEESREEMIPQTISEDHINKLSDMCMAAGIDPESTLTRLAMRIFNVNKPEKIPLYRFEEAVQKLETKIRETQNETRDS